MRRSKKTSAITQSPAIDRFKDLAQQDRFKGWPTVGEIRFGPKIPYFGKTAIVNYSTGNGIEDYTIFLRKFGWAVVFGVDTNRNVITLCQWKPGVNRASWELPPGGIGNVNAEDTIDQITDQTRLSYLKETGLGNGNFKCLGHVMIETAKYRGAGVENHGLPAYLFLATDLQRIQSARRPNPNEIMETLLVPLDEFPAILDSGLFVETSAVACAYKALIELGKLGYLKKKK